MKPVPLLALLVVLFASCKQHESAANPGAAFVDQTVTNNSTAPTMAEQVPKLAATEPLVIPDSPDTQATLGELSSALRNYVSSTRSAPRDFQDFVVRARLTAPPPPPGKAYAISAGQVILVDARK